VPEPVHTIDGRELRSIRTRDSIIDALLDLLRSGDLSPSSNRIAEAAGVSARSIFVHFADVEAIYLAATLRQIELHPELAVPTVADGDLEDRIDLLVSRRCATYSSVAPVRRAAIVHEHESETIARVMSTVRQFHQSDVERVFAQELSARSPVERRMVGDAISVASSFATWDHLERSGATGMQIFSTMRCLVAGALSSPEQGAAEALVD